MVKNKGWFNKKKTKLVSSVNIKAGLCSKLDGTATITPCYPPVPNLVTSIPV